MGLRFELSALCGVFAAQSDDQAPPAKAPVQRKTAATKKPAAAMKPAASKKKAAGIKTSLPSLFRDWGCNSSCTHLSDMFLVSTRRSDT